MTFLIIGLAIVIFVWLVWQPAWLPQPTWLPQPNELFKDNWQLEHQLNQWTAKGAEVTANWQQTLRRPLWPFATPNTTAFKQWALDNLPALYAQQHVNDAKGLTAFQQWLSTLSETDFAAYTRSTAAFCQALGFELSWLWQDTPHREQVATLRDSILLHTQAYAKAHASQVFAAYVQWQTNPHAATQQALTAQLFNQLVTQQQLPCPPELLLAPAAERQTFVTQTLRTFAQQQPTVFMAAFETAWRAGH